MYHSWKYFLSRALPLTLAGAISISPMWAARQPSIPEGWTSPFADVVEEDWFYSFVAALNAQDVVHGYDNGRFGPNDTTRAGDSMIMVLKAAGSGTISPNPGEHYASGYVRYALEKGWLTQEEVPADLNGPVSRLFIAHLAAKALGVVPIADATPFADVDDSSVTALNRLGILVGNLVDGQRLFHPEDSITRAELSTIVWQIQRYAGRTSGEEEYFPFYSFTLQALDNVPANSYDNSAFQLKDGWMEYTGDAQATVGIDISYHQGEIDWKKVAADGIDFAMIRGAGRYYGSGKVFEDTQFRRNLQGAMDAGLDVGVYFFSQATTVQEAREEAQFLLQLLEKFSAFDGPVVFDWENIDYDTARTDGVDSNTITAAANAFCQEVEQAGYQPMIYFNRYIAYLHYNLEDVAQYPFWIAEYGSSPNFRYDFQIWQYTDSGTVDGIQGPVDMNIGFRP